MWKGNKMLERIDKEIEDTNIIKVHCTLMWKFHNKIPLYN
jgi:hypothetical protein